MKKWERFTEDEIKLFTQESKSYVQLAEKIGYDSSAINGSAYRAIHQMIDELNLDTTHFTGQGWKKDQFDYSRFCYGKSIRPARMLSAIAALRGHKCENCGLSEWMGKKIALEVHHKDGDSLNNELSNLQLLCPNCHSLTDNWRGRGIGKKEQELIDEQQFLCALQTSTSIRQALLKLGLTAKGGNYNTAKKIIQKYHIQLLKQPKQLKPSKVQKNKNNERKQKVCLVCGQPFYPTSSSVGKYCSQKCAHIAQHKTEHPSRDELKQLIRTTPFLKIGEHFHVSDNAIRKWCKSFNLPYKLSDIKNYSDEEWSLI